VDGDKDEDKEGEEARVVSVALAAFVVVRELILEEDETILIRVAS
jgi:hypothetical protein